MVRMTVKARHAVVGAARRSVESVKSVAGDALGAAAKAAAGVVIKSTADALRVGQTKIKQSAPSVKRSAGRLAKQAVSGSPRKKSVRKRSSKTRRRVSKRSR